MAHHVPLDSSSFFSSLVVQPLDLDVLPKANGEVELPKIDLRVPLVLPKGFTREARKRPCENESCNVDPPTKKVHVMPCMSRLRGMASSTSDENCWLDGVVLPISDVVPAAVAEITLQDAAAAISATAAIATQDLWSGGSSPNCRTSYERNSEQSGQPSITLTNLGNRYDISKYPLFAGALKTMGGAFAGKKNNKIPQNLYSSDMSMTGTATSLPQIEIRHQQITLVCKINPTRWLHSIMVDRDVEHWEATWKTLKLMKRGKDKIPRTFSLLNNTDYNLAPTPPSWHPSLPLRDAQRRSLSWMQEREGKATHLDIKWIERVAWDGLPLFRNEASPGFQFNANVVYHIRGGVLCDEIGFGKTVITIGLMDADRAVPPVFEYLEEHAASRAGDAKGGEKKKVDAQLLSDVLTTANWRMYSGEEKDTKRSASDGCPSTHFPSAATLILVSKNLLFQWPSEIKRFLTTNEKIIVIKNVCDLKLLTVAELQNAFAVVCNFQLFYSVPYRKRMLELSGEGSNSVLENWSYQTTSINRFNLRYFTKQFIANCERDDRRDGVQWIPWKKKLTGTTHYGDMKYPVLEQFYWHRVVFDEFHEVEAMGADQHLALQNLLGHTRWGLTGTFNCLESHIRVMAQIFRCDLPEGSYQKFLDVTCRKNAAEPPHVPRNPDKIVKVSLTPHERIIYMSHSDLVRGNNPSFEAREQAVKFCSHFSFQKGKSRAADECIRISNKKKSNEENACTMFLQCLEVARSLERRLGFQGRTFVRDAIGEYENSAQDLRIELRYKTSSEGHTPVDPCPDCKSMAPGKLKEELQRRWTTYSEIKRQSAYFAKTLQLLESGEEVECPVCMGNFNLLDGTLSITSCAHVYCTECIDAVLANDGYGDTNMCPTCRKVLRRKRDITPLIFEMKSLFDKKKGEEQDDIGSKLRAVADTLKDIVKKNERVLVFCQWEDLKKKVAEAFTKLKVDFCVVQGNAFTRCTAIAKFQDGTSEPVMLLSLEDSASGTNLTAANHVILIHPMVASSVEKARANERQAVGRVRRQGQTKPVQLWRFVTENTLEEDMQNANFVDENQAPFRAVIDIL
eukprot:GEMP01004123.1.p1 GENE.GEMP01004123.1~~GEMP01004123.1.p1  ORF type:complete len:1077 (+),score=243.78 GEMP01004123.1:175-3405(+)